MINNQLKDAPDFVKEMLSQAGDYEANRQEAGDRVLFFILHQMIRESGVKLSDKKVYDLAGVLADGLAEFTSYEPDAVAWMLAAINGMPYKNNAGKRLHDFYPEEYGHA